jgi:hypothetical protein
MRTAGVVATDLDDRDVSIAYLTPERFAASSQVALLIRQNWRSLRTWLTSPTFAGDKKAAGAWCPAELEGGIVKDGAGLVSLLVFDVDTCAVGGIDRSARALGHYAGVVVPTFGASTGEKLEAHRIVLLPSRPLAPDEFRIAWPWMNRALTGSGIVIDRGCKNINRLYFACVGRSPETWLGARLLSGEPVPVDGLLAAAREELAEAEASRARRLPTRPVSDAHRDRYTRRAFDSARRNIEAAGEGGRHDALLREAFSLARLDLSEDQIRGALLESFVYAAGESRRREGERAISDAVSARRKGAA